MALAATILIIVMLVKVGALGPRLIQQKPRIIRFELQPEPRRHAPTVARVAQASGAKARVHAPPVPPLNMVILSPKDYAAADIAALPSHQASGSEGADAAADSGSSPGGPDGERLYDVDWYVRPTHAELAPYMPAAGPPSGSATIACRMIAQYHVEDCRELDESPAGSGLSRALRLASWQFRVRPPRVGGRSILGGWVRIHFIFTETAAD